MGSSAVVNRLWDFLVDLLVLQLKAVLLILMVLLMVLVLLSIDSGVKLEVHGYYNINLMNI